MSLSYTTLLGLVEPTSGTQSGTWGDDVNRGLTEYLDTAIAGTQIISGTQTAVTLSVTNGSSFGSNIAQVGSVGVTGTAQYAVINCTGNPAGTLTITVPSSSRQYLVINATSTSRLVKVVGAGPTTGVNILPSETALVVWNGSDFAKIIPGAAGTNTISYPATSLTTGLNNTLYGYNSGRDLTTGSGNIAIGSNALLTATTNSSNIAIGQSASQAAGVGVSTSIAIGYNALFTGGNNSVGIGYLAGFQNTGSANIAIGNSALQASSSAGGNVAVGVTAGGNNSTGIQQVFIGYSSGVQNTTGSQNTFVGYNSGYANVSGSTNTAVGNEALYTNISGSNLTVLGYQAGYVSTGSANTFIGASSGNAMTTGASNSIFGAFSGNSGGLDIRTSSSYIVLSNGSGAWRLYYDNNGNFVSTVTGTAPTLVANSTLTYELTSNTELKIKVRGTDGTTRSVSLTLA
jgi:hypothetical protein